MMTAVGGHCKLGRGGARPVRGKRCNAGERIRQTPLAQQEGGDVTLRFLVGVSHEIGHALSLDDDWAMHVIEATGNFGEKYERDLGSRSAMLLPRGENNLRERGGVMTALPQK